MKKIFGVVTTAALLLFAGCTKDLSQDIAPDFGGATLTLGLESSRTELGDLTDGVRKVYWNSDDQIAVNGQASAEIAVAEDNAGYATFTFAQAITYPANILYPAEMYKDASTITLPAVQENRTGSFGPDSAPMVAVAQEAGAPVMKHLMSVLRLRILKSAAEGADDCSIMSVSVKGNSGEQMSGDFTVDYAAQTLTGASSADADKVVVAKVLKALDTEDAVDVFVVIPTRVYANGLTVTVKDYMGHYMEKVAEVANLDIERGKIYALPAFTFVPTGTSLDADIAIASAAEWNAFVANYNAGLYNGKTVSVKLTADVEFDDATNAAFAQLGVGDAVDDTFMGTIDGAGFAFKNLQAGSALIHRATGSSFKNIVLDSSCAITYKDVVFDSDYYAAAIVEDIFKTSMEGCVNGATLTIDNCSSEGDYTFHIAGVVARTNAECSLVNCANTGKVESTSSCCFGAVKGYGVVYHGGIVGYTRCPLTDCKNEGAIISNYNGDTKNVGGIVGRATGTSNLVNCTNSGSVKDDTLRTPAINEIYDYNRTVHIAGIVGVPACDVANCKNTGAISSKTGAKTLNIGGVVACLNGTDLVLKDNSNTGDLSVNCGARYVSMGGLIGNTNNKSMLPLDLEGDEFAGTLTIASMEDTNSTNISQFGGVIGLYQSTNFTPLVITNATFTGSIEYSSKTVKIHRNYLGGIVGVADALQISKSTNKGSIEHTARSVSNKNFPYALGGIVGAIRAGESSVVDCHNTGALQQWVYNNKEFGATHQANIFGGILGGYGYDLTYPGTNADNHAHHTINPVSITISDCTNTGDMGSYRGLMGGIVGYVVKGAVSDCSVECNLYANTAFGSPQTGGIAGAADDSTISNCWCKSDITAKLAGSLFARAGGVAAFLINGSKLSNCAYYGSVAYVENANNSFSGGMAAEVYGAAVTIENCKFGGSVQGVEITADIIDSYVIGEGSVSGTNGDANISGITVWDGTVSE